MIGNSLGGGRRRRPWRRLLFRTGVLGRPSPFVLFFALARQSNVAPHRGPCSTSARPPLPRRSRTPRRAGAPEALKAKLDAERTLTRAASESDAILQQARARRPSAMQARAAASLKSRGGVARATGGSTASPSRRPRPRSTCANTAVDVALAATRRACCASRSDRAARVALIEEAIGELPRRLALSFPTDCPHKSIAGYLGAPAARRGLFFAASMVGSAIGILARSLHKIRAAGRTAWMN